MGVPRPLRHRRFTLFFTARLVSLLGSSMTPVALAFAVLDSSRTTGDLGVVLAANMVPMLALLLVGGSVADRFPRALVLRAANLGSGVTQLVAAGILLTGDYSLPALIATEFLNGVLTAFTTPALRGIVPQLVERASLRQANSLLATARNVAKVTGPSLAGVLVVTTSGGWAIAADGVSFLVAGALLSALKLPPAPAAARESVVRGIREGWRHFRRIPWLWQIVAAYTVVNIAQTGVWQVLGPIIARDTVGEASWDVVLSVRAGGVLITGVLMYRVAIRRMLSLGQLCAALGATPLLVLGTHPGFPALAAAALIAGVGSGVANVAWDTTMHENIPSTCCRAWLPTTTSVPTWAFPSASSPRGPWPRPSARVPWPPPAACSSRRPRSSRCCRRLCGACATTRSRPPPCRDGEGACSDPQWRITRAAGTAGRSANRGRSRRRSPRSCGS
ncbi:MFS transporter [Amycolatopsis sp. FDAARGOS 1241]|uniref:MFS transporter n=1 Tax=Amycolatopsis sp. FDAARGOS 1241 TaxID=2778070 RepID=UPI0019523F6F|nr:MFS transporter [Amycolatopsis sp. FDAARGOS 1241]QRP44659.1 MFS transporter [Amycolatopsis sp. FDAARGOS 1241]